MLGFHNIVHKSIDEIKAGSVNRMATYLVPPLQCLKLSSLFKNVTLSFTLLIRGGTVFIHTTV